MAKAEKMTLPIVPPPYEIILTLTQEEAETLDVLLNRVGGDPLLSRRKYAETMHAALRDAGVRGRDNGIMKENRAIYFED